MHHHTVCVDSTTPGLFTNPQGIEGMKSVGTQLHAGADFANLGGLLKYLYLKTLSYQGQCGGEPANAAS
jgi:hypothetical protein